jgi:hypothetical protein
MDFYTFSNFINGKIRIFISSEPQLYIHVRLLLVEPVPKHETVSPNSIHSSRKCSPKFGAVPTPATTPTSNYSQSVHRLQNPRVALRSSRRGLCLDMSCSSIRPPNLRQSTISSSAPAKLYFPVRNLHCCTYGFFVSPFSRRCKASLSLPSLPPAAAPLRAPFPPPARAPLPPGITAAARGLARRCATVAAWPARPPCEALLPFPLLLSLPWIGGRR